MFASAGAMVPAAEIAPRLAVEPVDHSGLEIGDEELLVPGVVGDVAEGRTAVRAPIEHYVGELFGSEAGIGAEPENRARPRIRSPKAGHPVPIRPVKAEGR